FLSKKLGMDAIQFGYLQTIGAAAMFTGSPIFGRIADHYGARYAVIIADLSSLCYYLMVAFASSKYLLFLSQIALCLAHGLPAHQMIASDVSDPKERPDALGKVGMCFGFGMLVGSVLGGWIQASYGEQTTAMISAFGAVLHVMITMMFIPKNTKMYLGNSEDEQKGYKKSSSTSISDAFRLLAYPHVLFLLVLKLVSFLPLGLIQSVISLILMDHFHLGAQANGLMLAYLGVLTTIVQGFFVGYITDLYSQYTVLKYDSMSLIIIYIIMAFTTNLIPYCLAMFLLAMGTDTFQVILSSCLTSLAPESDSGSMIGMIATVEFGIRLISPPIASYLFSIYGITMFGWVGLLSSVLLVLLFASYSEIHIKND
ncbi:uncharacterized protein TRIADDRAFT_27771, partial [Trichoplax adhaerens]